MPQPPLGAIVDPIFMPAVREIAGISLTNPAIVVTTFDHGYLDGAIVRLHIPQYFGMEQANNLKGSITLLSATAFTIDIDTTTFDPFLIPTYLPQPAPYQTAQVIPVGEDTDHLDSAFRNILTPLF